MDPRKNETGQMAEQIWFSLDLAELPDRYAGILDQISKVLELYGIGASLGFTIRDIALEYLLNWTLHTGNVREKGRLEIGGLKDRVIVRIIGTGDPMHIERMRDVVESFTDYSPDHLFDELDRRRFEEKTWNTPGAGLGLLTIAALANGNLHFHTNRRNPKRFFLEATVHRGM